MKHLVDMLGSVFLLVATVACSASAQEESSQAQWPIELELGSSRLVVYELQPESLSGDALSARAAVSLRRTKQAEPIFGAVWIDARVQTDRDSRTVTLLDVKVPDVQFPGVTAEERTQLTEALQAQLPLQRPTLSLDLVVATLDSAKPGAPNAVGLRDDPPHILFVEKPTALVSIDGPPELRQVEGSSAGVMRVINTPFILLFDPARKTYHLKAGARWRSAETTAGPWLDETSPPDAIVSAVPQGDSGVKSSALADDVDVIVVTEPTELIVSRGAPSWTPLPGDELMYLANSENDVFFEPATNAQYVLLAGRWFKSSEDSAWTYVPSDELPDAFARIPENSPKASVRTFVAGTTEARAAVLDASIPQTTAVKRDDAHCSVTYDGAPRFAPIPGTSLRYAVNTSAYVIELDSRYYCCSDGVWYVSDQATGPWRVATEVPGEFDSIPPSSPVYPVRYVYIYDTTPDYVYVGYLPGYTGCYVHGATIVYGTGYWYPGWIGVTYYPRPCTWGFYPRYDPWFCGWSFGFSFAWGMNPWWFNHSCGWGSPGWWGPSGFYGHNFAIQSAVVTPTFPSRVRRGSTVVATPSAGRENLYVREPNRSRLAPFAASVQREAAVARTTRSTALPNDVFAAEDGRVLRQTRDGWEERRSDQWTRVSPQASAPSAGTSRSPAPSSRIPSRDSTLDDRRNTTTATPLDRAAPTPDRSGRIPERLGPAAGRSRGDRSGLAPPVATPPAGQATPPATRPAPPAVGPTRPESRPNPYELRAPPPETSPSPPAVRPAPPEARPTPSTERPPDLRPPPPELRPAPPVYRPAPPSVRPPPPVARPPAARPSRPRPVPPQGGGNVERRDPRSGSSSPSSAGRRLERSGGGSSG